MGFIQKLTGLGQYTPTQAYSLELQNRRNGNTIAEVFMLLPPESYTLQQGYRVAVSKTATGGGFIQDFGNDFKKLRVSWNIWFYWIGEPKKKPTTSSGVGQAVESIVNNFGSAAKNALGALGLYDKLSGLDAYYIMRYIFSEGRDLSLLTNKDNPIHPKENDFRGTDRFTREGMGDVVNSAVSTQLNYADIKYIWHDYDDANHYEVIIDNMEIQRNASDTFSFILNLDMTLLKPVYGTPILTGDIEEFTNPAEIFKNFSNIVGTFTGIADNFLNFFSNIGDVFSSLQFFLEDTDNEVNKLANKAGVTFNTIKDKVNNLLDYLGIIDGDVNKSAYESIAYNATSSYTDYLAGDEVLPRLNTFTQLYDVSNATNELIKGLKIYSQYEEQRSQDYIQSDFMLANTKFKTTSGELKSYPLYTVKESDTLYNLSIRFFGDIRYSKLISEINNISPRDFENSGLVGKVIKIPLEVQYNKEFFRKNKVYSYKKNRPFINQREKEIDYFGVDIKLDNKKMSLDSSGDLNYTYGQKSWISDVEARLTSPIKSLNELHPGWGLPIIVGDFLGDVVFDKKVSAIESQALKDPRTKSANVTDIKWVGNTMYFTIFLSNVLEDIAEINVPATADNTAFQGVF